jgi:hypothetical protein
MTSLVVDEREILAPSSGGDIFEFFSGKVAQDRFERIISLTRVHLIVDCLNLATQLSDPHAWPSALSSLKEPAVRESVGLAISLAAMKGHSIALDEWLFQKTEAAYVKVSTTGLGRRGLEIPFTHGDTGDRLSPNLWRKLFVAGVNHQLLWALSRTFPSRVHIIVPAAFVGFENIEDVLEKDRPTVFDTVQAGEDRSYTSEEIAVISSHHQMGTVTKEEVAVAVVDTLVGTRKDVDLLSALNSAVIPPSTQGRAQRQLVLDRLRQGSLSTGVVASGSLGERVDFALKTLRELHATHGTGRSLGALLQTANDNYGAIDAVGKPLFSPEQEVLVRWITASLEKLEQTLPAEDLPELHKLLESTDWTEGDLLAHLWHGDEVRYALL